jgi:phosphoglycerate dehydrogenase-like enzyme
VRQRIVIPDDFPPVYGDHPVLEELQRLAAVSVYAGRADTREELLQRLAGAEVVINVRAYTQFDEALFAALPGLRMVAIFGVGTDNFDLDAASRQGVVVANCPGVNARSVAEHAIALMFAAARTLPAYDRDVRAGLWRHHEGVELEGKTLGVIGLGNIGRRVAQMGAGIGMRVLAWSPREDPQRAAASRATLVDLDRLFGESDVVQVCIALSDRTRGLVGERELRLMRPGAILVNTARGAIVDDAALLAALSERRIRAAALDVFAEEPLPGGSPFVSLDNVLLTPHAGWVTAEARDRLIAEPVHNIASYLDGRATNVVNPASLEHAKQRQPA